MCCAWVGSNPLVHRIEVSKLAKDNNQALAASLHSWNVSETIKQWLDRNHWQVENTVIGKGVWFSAAWRTSPSGEVVACSTNRRMKTNVVVEMLHKTDQASLDSVEAELTIPWARSIGVELVQVR